MWAIFNLIIYILFEPFTTGIALKVRVRVNPFPIDVSGSAHWALEVGNVPQVEPLLILP